MRLGDRKEERGLRQTEASYPLQKSDDLDLKPCERDGLTAGMELFAKEKGTSNQQGRHWGRKAESPTPETASAQF